jgi:hypothetical protein
VGEVIDQMAAMKIAAARCAKAMDDFVIAYMMVQEYSSDPHAMDEAETHLREMKMRMRILDV